MFSIALDDAIKTLPDGRNAHITVRSAQWWQRKLSQHFVVAEAGASQDSAYFVCQKPDAKEKMLSEQGSANSVAVAA